MESGWIDKQPPTVSITISIGGFLSCILVTFGIAAHFTPLLHTPPDKPCALVFVAVNLDWTH